MNTEGAYESYPVVELDSDADECLSSSEDEVDIILHGTPQQKRKLRRKSLGQESSSEDEFEKEMEAELDRRMLNIAAMQTGKKTPVQEQIPNPREEEEEFLGPESDDDTAPSAQPAVPSNDELFYDPDLDDRDQQWVNKQRQRYQPSMTAAENGHKCTKKMPSSDATLCCPACMIVLCRDCQRHSLYKNQFRAMFVTNCNVDKSEILRYPRVDQQSKKKKKKKTGSCNTVDMTKLESNTDSTNVAATSSGPCPNNEMDSYNPVRCTQCTIQVGVYDSDEVYHFFNVLESIS